MNFSEVRPRQILDLGKQFNLVMSFKRLKGIFARRIQNVLKTSWRHFCRASLKTSWRCLEAVFKDVLQNVLKTPWRRLEDAWPRPIYWSWSRRLEDVFKTPSEDVWLGRIYWSWSRHLEDVFKTSSEGEDERRLQDAFIKTNVCRDRVLAIKSKHYKWNVLKLFTGAVVRRCSSK